MKAIQVTKPYEISVVDVPMPEIGADNEVRVRIHAAGLCGSDVHIYHGKNIFATYPRIIGHEAAGVVESIGSGVSTLQVGDKVCLEPISYCGTCYACLSGRPNVCAKLEVFGVHRDGGHAQYLVAPEKNFHKVPQHFTFAQAAAIEPFTIGAQCAYRGGVKAGDVVLITGAGPMGLIACDTCKSLGATVIVSEINDYRLNLVKEFGADYTINPEKEDLAEKLAEITNGMGPNVVLEATGVPALVSQAVELVSVAGRVVPLGFGAEPVPINLAMLTKKEVGLFGSRLQTYQFAPVIERLSKDLSKVDKLIAKIYPAEDVKQAIEDFTAPASKVSKAILEF